MDKSPLFLEAREQEDRGRRSMLHEATNVTCFDTTDPLPVTAYGPPQQQLQKRKVLQTSPQHTNVHVAPTRVTVPSSITTSSHAMADVRGKDQRRETNNAPQRVVTLRRDQCAFIPQAPADSTHRAQTCNTTRETRYRVLRQPHRPWTAVNLSDMVWHSRNRRESATGLMSGQPCATLELKPLPKNDNDKLNVAVCTTASNDDVIARNGKAKSPLHAATPSEMPCARSAPEPVLPMARQKHKSPTDLSSKAKTALTPTVNRTPNVRPVNDEHVADVSQYDQLFLNIQANSQQSPVNASSGETVVKADVTLLSTAEPPTKEVGLVGRHMSFMEPSDGLSVRRYTAAKRGVAGPVAVLENSVQNEQRPTTVQADDAQRVLSSNMLSAEKKRVDILLRVPYSTLKERKNQHQDPLPTDWELASAYRQSVVSSISSTSLSKRNEHSLERLHGVARCHVMRSAASHKEHRLLASTLQRQESVHHEGVSSSVDAVTHACGRGEVEGCQWERAGGESEASAAAPLDEKPFESTPFVLTPPFAPQPPPLLRAASADRLYLPAWCSPRSGASRHDPQARGLRVVPLNKPRSTSSSVAGAEEGLHVRASSTIPRRSTPLETNVYSENGFQFSPQRPLKKTTFQTPSLFTSLKTTYHGCLVVPSTGQHPLQKLRRGNASRGFMAADGKNGASVVEPSSDDSLADYVMTADCFVRHGVYESVQPHNNPRRSNLTSRDDSRDTRPGFLENGVSNALRTEEPRAEGHQRAQERNEQQPRELPSLSETLRTIAGLVSLKGCKPLLPNRPDCSKNQDRAFVQNIRPNVTAFGVFDGHGEFGHDVAQYVADQFRESVVADLSDEATLMRGPLQSEKKFLTWMRNLFRRIDKKLLKCHPVPLNLRYRYQQAAVAITHAMFKRSGTTGSLAIRVENSVYVGYVGDSKVVGYCFRGSTPGTQNACPLTTLTVKVMETPEHNPIATAELRHIRNAGGRVSEILFQHLNKSVSRIVEADLEARQFGLICEPEFVKFDIEPQPQGAAQRLYPMILVLATDGLWDTMSSRDVLRFFNNEQCHKDSLVLALKKMTLASWQKRLDHEGRSDDTTAILALIA